MATPASLQPAPLFSLGDFSARRLIDDDFSVGKATLKVKAPATNGGVANYKGSLDISKNYAPNQETRFQFPYKNYYFWFATRREQTKVHIDLGEYQVIKKQNFFANIQFYNSQSKSTLRFGSVYQGTRCLSHARIEWQNQDKVNLLLRAQVKHSNWVYVIANQLCLNKKEFDKLDFLVGYQAQNYDIYLRHFTNTNPNIPLFGNFGIGRFVLDTIYRNKSNTFGFEVEYSPLSQYRLVFAAATKKSGIDYKARVDLYFKKFGLVAKGKINEKFAWTLSTEVPIDGRKPEQFGYLPAPIGFTVETTI